MSTFTLMRRISIAAYVKPRLAQFPTATEILRNNNGECWENSVNCDACPFGISLKCCLYYDDDFDAIPHRSRRVFRDLGVL